MSTAEQLIKWACDKHGVDQKALLSKNRRENLVRFRRMIAYALRTVDEKKYSLKRLGKILGGRDHSTIRHGLKEMEYVREKDIRVRVTTKEMILQYREITEMKSAYIPDLGIDLSDYCFDVSYIE